MREIRRPLAFILGVMLAGVPVLLATDHPMMGQTAPEFDLIIDPQGKIQFYSLLDSMSFDAKLVQLQERLDQLLADPED